MKSLLVISSIEPGTTYKVQPSGLLHKIIDELKDSFKIDIVVKQKITRINKLSFFLKKDKIEILADYDLVLFYPFYMVYSVKMSRPKDCYVLGPDSNSLVWKRRANVNIDKARIRGLIYFLISKIFLIREKHISNQNVKLIVVGKNDQLYMEDNNIKNVRYLTHPIIEEEKIIEVGKCKGKRKLVISGFYNKEMVCKRSIDIINQINTVETIIICGRKNKWLQEHFKNFEIEYIPFVENYQEICNPDLHIHVCPIAYGGGTKNRVLSSLFFGCLVFGTEIANENIFHPNLYKIEDLKNLESIKVKDWKNFKNKLDGMFKNDLQKILN